MRLRIANPEKFISRFGCLVLVVVLLAGVGLNRFMDRHELKIDSDAVMMVTVKPGDTLWNIVRTTHPSVADIRFIVQDTIRLNDLDGHGNITPGQRIMLPINYADMLADN